MNIETLARQGKRLAVYDRPHGKVLRCVACHLGWTCQGNDARILKKALQHWRHSHRTQIANRKRLVSPSLLRIREIETIAIGHRTKAARRKRITRKVQP